MAKLSIPAISPELQQAFEPIIHQKCLDDDTKWEKSILPIFLDRLKSIETQIRQSVTSNANTPSTQVLDDITRTISRIRMHLQEYFPTAAPFTIRRIAEMVLLYEESEYSLSTVALANKYLLSLARLVCVQSKETSFREVSLSDSRSGEDQKRNGLSSTDYDKYGLPKDIEYSRLLWEDAPITETIMVKDKAELLEVVAEKGLSKSSSVEKQIEHSEANKNEASDKTVENGKNLGDSTLDNVILSETRVSQEKLEVHEAEGSDDSVATETKETSNASVEKLEHQEVMPETVSEAPSTSANHENPATKKAKLE